MMNLQDMFEKLETLIQRDGSNFVFLLFKPEHTFQNSDLNNDIHFDQSVFIKTIIGLIDELSSMITTDESILISVKNQKILRTCFQLIISLGLTHSLIPGLGISLNKRCSNAAKLPKQNLSDEEKYESLIFYIDFFTRSYKIPVLKNIILTFHLSDYLAALIQVVFAPLKKPGTYKNFVMTEDMYKNLLLDREKYLSVYENLVSNCFQPILMKELLILQGVEDPPPPTFVKRAVSREMSRRLLMPAGLLSLIRCFIEGYSTDTGLDWKKHDLICKIVTMKHGTGSEDNYLNNICSQLEQLLSLNNPQYISIATKCIHFLNGKYPNSDVVQNLRLKILKVFHVDDLNSKATLPGTILMTFQQIEHNVNILNSCICTPDLLWPDELLCPNIFVLYWISLKNTKSEELRSKLMNIIMKILHCSAKGRLSDIIEDLLFCSNKNKNLTKFTIEEFDSGVAIKCINADFVYPKEETLNFFIELIKNCTEIILLYKMFEILLDLLMDLSNKRSTNNETLLNIEDDPEILTETNYQYATVLQLLSEMATLPKIISSIRADSKAVIHFVEYFLFRNCNYNDECVTVALILLNTILTNSKNHSAVQSSKLIPILKKISTDKSNFNYILCDEILSLLISGTPTNVKTLYSKAILDLSDNLLPTRAHGLIQLTKLIEAKDPETISKKHYVFCLFQEHLKDSDSYIYLSAINGIAALGTYCTEDVLHVLCKEFLGISSEQPGPNTKETQLKVAELRMKIGDIIVKVTKKLGEMAVVHKTILLNTILCGCRDDDPFIRTSALSNLAEIALVLNYKLGTIVYEVLSCIWSTIETDKALECRRAAVMVIASLLKGLGNETLIQLKDNLLPVYRTLKKLYIDPCEDSILKLHAQIALEELNEIVENFLFPQLKMERSLIIDKEVDHIIFK